MKRLLIFLSLVLPQSLLLGMEKENIAYDGIPQLLIVDRVYKIRATADKREIGSILYKQEPTEKNAKEWEIKEFFLEEEFRKQGIGFKLFTHCIEHLKMQKCNSVWWTVRPMTVTMSISELMAVYKKILTKLKYPESAIKTNWTDNANGTKSIRMSLALE